MVQNLDGMDVAVCQIHKFEDKATVKFCGAKRPLAIYRKDNQEVELVKGTNLSIGGKQKRNKEFESETFNLTKDDCIYLFTDGYTDQNSSDGNKVRNSSVRSPTQKMRSVAYEKSKNYLGRPPKSTPRRSSATR